MTTYGVDGLPEAEYANNSHGKQQLSLFHGYYKQHQYFPMMIFEGETGMPLGAWLRPGNMAASCGATDMLASIVERRRQHWPDLQIFVRVLLHSVSGRPSTPLRDCGLATPEMYEFCERHDEVNFLGRVALVGVNMSVSVANRKMESAQTL